MGLFRVLPDRSKSDNSLGWGFWGGSKPILPTVEASRLLVFIASQAVRLLQSWREEDEGGAR